MTEPAEGSLQRVDLREDVGVARDVAHRGPVVPMPNDPLAVDDEQHGHAAKLEKPNRLTVHFRNDVSRIR